MSAATETNPATPRNRKNIMKSTAIRRFAAVAAVTGALTAGLATAALADTNPVSVSGTVNQSVTLSGITNSIAFPATNPGNSGTATGAESYAVASNDPAGYTLTVTPGAFSMHDSASDQLPNNVISVSETGGTGHGGNFMGSSPLTVDSTNSAASKNYAEDWTWNIPGNQPAGNYNEQFSYLVLGN